MPDSRTSRPRSIAFLMYLMFGAAGFVFLFLPPPTLYAEATGLGLITWHIFLSVGSAIGLIGVIRKNNVVEAIGIPLILAALAVYAVALLKVGIPARSGGQIGYGLILIANVFGLGGRGSEVWKRIKLAEEIERRFGD